jgi:hypothetical protein
MTTLTRAGGPVGDCVTALVARAEIYEGWRWRSIFLGSLVEGDGT